MSKEALVIGAGLGGLLCGRILSREGWHVTVLEQGIQAGGALQTFVRAGLRFDTGFHSVGGLGPGEPLEQVFRPLGLMELPWYQVEADEYINCDLPFMRLSSQTEDEIAHVADPYRLSVWRLKGGGKTLVDALKEGLDVQLRKKVVEISDRSVTCADGSTYKADIVVSDLHPLTTFRMVQDHVRPAYLKRLERLPNGPGAFTVNVALKPGVLPYVNHSIFLDGEVMIHFGEADENGFAKSLDLLKFVQPGYDRESCTKELIEHASRRLPNLPEAINQYWTSTPATWERFTGTPGGSAFGIVKQSQAEYLAPVTPLPWLFLTGQNIGLHGVLGTSIAAVNTCNSIKNVCDTL